MTLQPDNSEHAPLGNQIISIQIIAKVIHKIKFRRMQALKVTGNRLKLQFQVCD